MDTRRPRPVTPPSSRERFLSQETPFVKTPRTGDLLSTATSLLVFATAPAMLESVHWTLALAAHFRPHLLVAWAICGLAHVLSGRASGAVVALLTSVFLVLGLQVAPSPETSETADLTLMQVNVQMDAQETAPLVEHLRAQGPDIVSLVEIDQRWVDALGEGLDYPHVKMHPRADFLGLGLMSRYPIRSYEVRELSPGIPVATAVIEVPGKAITLTTLHVLPPVNGEWSRSQSAGLEVLAQERQQRGPRWVVCGDFNATPWSRVFRTFAATSGLSPVSAGGWFTGTWPAAIPVAGLAIDHCLLSPGLRVVEAKVGPSVSGDHRPLSISLDSRVR
jgi:endonuclease/exonuclease/phosphatase (EEP) superfamily protein YafD